MMQARLHKKLYSSAGVKNAISAYSELCHSEMAKDGDHYVVTFSAIDPDIKDVLVDEFANYALYGTIAGKKTW